MGRELQKKKNRSSIPKIKLKTRSKKRVNPLGNPIIAANWDSSKTLTQNYHRLGLTSRLNALTGGSAVKESKSSTTSKLAIVNAIPTVLAPSEARVERDEDGKIVRVIHSGARKKRANPLNDPLNEILSDDDDEGMGEGEWNGMEEDTEAVTRGNDEISSKVVAELEDLAAREKKKEPRKQSTREKEWVERLVTKYGDNVKGMVRDRRLNPMQQTEPDITRRIKKWRAENEAIAV